MQQYIQLCKKHLVKPDEQYFQQLKLQELFPRIGSFTLKKANGLVAVELLKNMNLQRLYLEDMPMNKYFSQLLGALKNSPNLLELSLINCSFSAHQTTILFKLMSSFSKLDLLDISQNQFNIESICKVQLKITKLSMRGSTFLNPNYFSDLMKSLSNLKSLDLRQNNLRPMTNFIEFALNFFNLQPETLNLSFCYVSKPQLREVISLLKITKSCVLVHVDGLNLVEEGTIFKAQLNNFEFGSAQLKNLMEEMEEPVIVGASQLVGLEDIK
ncbi:Leucine-rich_repeat domain superfamily [Hexamita inflata]|uniref:Leucine-rich repeat domain superfamily n=1 Tax=Hexamita inflata TaxID=28002 RepID=A0AA86RGT8_9EUKA|nr:Leucine-rich repeat domain superfamily [Hexamita inflata]